LDAISGILLLTRESNRPITEEKKKETCKQQHDDRAEKRTNAKEEQ